MAVWLSGNTLVSISEVYLCWARLVLGWVTGSGLTPGGGTLFRYVTNHYCRQRSSILLDLSTETSALPQRKDGLLGVCRCVSECVEGGVSRRWRWTGCWVFLTRPLYVCSTVWLSRDWCCCWICHCRLPIIAPVYHTHTLCPENCMYVQVSLRPENLQYEIWYL